MMEAFAEQYCSFHPGQFRTVGKSSRLRFLQNFKSEKTNKKLPCTPLSSIVEVLQSTEDYFIHSCVFNRLVPVGIIRVFIFYEISVCSGSRYMLPCMLQSIVCDCSVDFCSCDAM